MILKDIFNTLFSYTPKDNYHFSILENKQIQHQESSDNESSNEKTKIYPSLNVNIEYMKTRYNLLINSDVVLREFTLNARGKQYNAFLVYIDGMADSKLMNDFILNPLMLRSRSNLFDSSQNKVISEAVSNNITVRKVKKFDLPNYLMGCLIPQNSVKEIKDFDEVAQGINARKLCSICWYIGLCFWYWG